MADSIVLRCPKCGETKTSDYFAKLKQGCYCRPCDKQYKHDHYMRNREKYLAMSHEWRVQNPERKRANDKAWYEANKERAIRLAKAWSARNPDKRKSAWSKYRLEKLERARANEAAYRARNREECNRRIREWKALNKHAVLAYAGKRRAAELQAVPAWANLDAIAEVYKQAKARGPGHHVDHIVPLISPCVCGLHCESNLQILTASENSRKNNRHWPDMWEPMLCPNSTPY